MGMKFMRSKVVLVSAAMTFLVAGCERDAKKSVLEAEPAAPAVGVLRVAEETQAKLGLTVQSAGRREIADALTTTGWVEPAPGREVAIKSPVSGFVVEAAGQKLPKLGEQIDRGEHLVSLHVFLTPQEVAQLVSAKEDVDIAIEQSRVSMRLA